VFFLVSLPYLLHDVVEIVALDEVIIVGHADCRRGDLVTESDPGT
jgi:hypothetical protein